jgi:tripartite-type tricarboxylate transporter receptor subunit TctC
MKLTRGQFFSLTGAANAINASSQVTAAQTCLVRPVRAVAAALAGALVLAAGPADAQNDFPNRPIHTIVPFPAGGIADVVTRIVTDKLSQIWHQPIVVEAKPGANGNLGWEQVARATPDGYTWTFVSPGIMANPRMYAKARWNEKSFVLVGAAAWAPSTFVVHPSLPVNTLAEFIDYARKHPGTLNWANPGMGTSMHLNTAIFLNATRLDMVAVPYGGQPPGILDLMANRVQFKIASIGLVAQHVNAGALKALAVLGTTRSPMLPNVPTVSEAGYPEINVVPWYGQGVPRGTPERVIEKIMAAFQDVLKNPSVRDALQRQALQPVEPMNASELVNLYAADTEKYAKVIREADIKLTN